MRLSYALNIKKNIANKFQMEQEILVGIVSAISGAAAAELIKATVVEKITLPNFERKWKNEKAPRTLVTVSLIQAGNLILMTKRKNCEYNLTWCFPAAKNYPNEVIYDRMIERYKQKFGINVRPLKMIGKGSFPRGNWELFYFHCRYESGDLNNLDTNENEHVQWVDVNQIQSLVTTQIHDSVMKKIKKIIEKG